MSIEWSDLLAGLSFYLVIEGILAFANPAGLKRMLARIVTLADSDLRRSGFIAIVLGVALLFVVRS